MLNNEMERDVLAFLDMNKFRDENGFSRTVHRKDTFSVVFTEFNAFKPDIYKKGLISTLLYRAYMINSSYHSLHNEIEELRNILKRNAYPNSFFNK